MNKEIDQTLHALSSVKPDSVFLIDLEGTVLAANETAVKRFDRPAEDIVGRNLFRLLPEYLVGPWREHVDRVIHSGQCVQFIDELQGSTIENSVSPLCDEHGAITRLVLIGRDIIGRVKGRAALHDSEKRFRVLFENSPMAISIAQNGVTIDANPAYLAIFGYADLQEVRGAHLLSQIAPQCHAQIGERAKRREQGETMPSAYETVGLRKDGSQFPLYAMVSRMDLPDGPATIGFFSDVSERKRAEEALQEREERFRIASQSVSDVIWEWDIINGKLDWFGEIDNLLGYAKGEFPRAIEAWEKLIVAEDRDAVMAALDRHLTTGDHYAKEYRVRNKNGDIAYWQDRGIALRNAEGEAIRMIGSILDITERKQAEQALQESERKFRDTIKNLDEGYYRCTLEGLLLEHNVAFNQIFSFPNDEDLKGKELPDFWQNPEDRKQYLHELSTQGFVRNFPINAKKIDGTQVVVMASAHLVTDEKDQMTSIEGTFTDFTEQKRMEKELIQAKDNLERLVSERTRELQEAITYNRNLIEASLDPLVMIGPEGKITDVNQATETITGRTRQELIGTDFSDYFTNPEKARAGYRQAFAEGFVRDYELLLRHADGHNTPVRYNATVYRDSLGQVVGVFAAARDVTEWKNTEETLVKNKQILDETGRLARVGGWEIDLRNNEMSWSDVVYQIHELDPACHPTLETAINFYAPEAIPVISEAVRRAMEEGEPYDLELQLITAKGNRLWVRAIGQAYWSNGKIIKIGGVFQDINDRKLAENELKRHRDHLEELVAERTAELTRSRELLLEAETVARLGSWEWDVVRDEIAGSAEFYRLFDVEPEQIAHLPQFIGLLHADDRERVQRDLAEALEQRKMFDTDYRVILSDGEWRHINARGRMYFDEKGKPLRMVGTCMNITERRRVEDALRESEVKYRELFENAQVGMYRSKLDGSALLAVNSKLCEIFGYSEEEMLGNPATIRWEDPRARDRMVTELLQAGFLHDYAMNIVRKSGDIRNCSVSISLYADKGYIEGSAIDITERKQAEEAAQEAAVRYNTFFNESSDGILIADIGTASFKYANPALCRMFGYTEDELRRMSLPDIHPKETLQSVVAEFEALARGDKTLAPGIPCLRKDGSVFHADVGAVKITVDGIPCNVGFFRDITERKQAEEELAKKAEELARSNAELEQFAYVASHDLQEPLRMISSYVQLLARHNQGKLDSDSEEFIAFAADGATRMQALIQDLLTFSRVGTWGKAFVPTDCDVVLERALNHLKVAIEESGARITSDPLPMLRADDSQLVQLFQNLVGNALKFHRPEIPPTIHIGAKRSGPDWVFTVRDNGIGIPAEQKQRVFEIFQRLHSRGEYPGTGIGLAVCRKIVERHGGRIWVESTVGEGSTFTFTLPQGNGNRISSPDESSK